MKMLRHKVTRQAEHEQDVAAKPERSYELQPWMLFQLSWLKLLMDTEQVDEVNELYEN